MTSSAIPDAAGTDAGPTMLYLVKQLELAVRAQLDDVLRPTGITPLQYTALSVLERRSDLSTAELARNAFVTDQSASDMVAALEDRGLVLRHADAADRRRRVLRLTDAGKTFLAEARPGVEDVEARMLAPLSAAEAASFRRFVATCRAALASTPPH